VSYIFIFVIQIMVTSVIFVLPILIQKIILILYIFIFEFNIKFYNYLPINGKTILF
jgi:hypothetical protein